MADLKCPECGATSPSNGGAQILTHEPGCPLSTATVTDKRGDRDVVAPPPEEVRLQEEAAAALLAAQAAAEAEAEPVPYEGAGMHAEVDEEALQPALTMFLVVVHNDGTAHAYSDLNILTEYDPLMPAAPKQMYRACAEIMLDIQAAENAEATIKALEIRTVAAAQAAHTNQRQAVQDAVRGNKRQR